MNKIAKLLIILVLLIIVVAGPIYSVVRNDGAMPPGTNLGDDTDSIDIVWIDTIDNVGSVLIGETLDIDGNVPK